MPTFLRSSHPRRATLTALVDPVRERAEALARTYGITPTIVSDVAEVLDQVDGAIIATPNHTHCDLALQCLAAKVPVLIEKPLACSIEEGQRIMDAEREAGVPVGVAYSTRFFPGVTLLSRLLEENYFGNVRRFVYQYGTVGGWAPLSSYILNRDQAGGGVLMVTATHFLDRMLALFGYPSQMEYRDDSGGGPEANCWARFDYHDRSVPLSGEIRLSKTMAIRGGVVLDTERGTVILEERADAPVRFRPAGSDSIEHEIRPTDIAPGDVEKSVPQLQLEDFIEACVNGGGPRVGSEQAQLSLKLIDELYACRQPLASDSYRASRERQAS